MVLPACWLIIIAVATADILATRDYVAMLDESSTLPADSLPFRRDSPAEYGDTRTWVRYGVYLADTSQWQLRRTDIDNAPFGRDVHWSSAFAHLVAVAGRISRGLTGLPLSLATERALSWFNLPLLILVVIAASAWVARRLGAAVGVMTAFALAGYSWFYDGFAPNNVDHHGLLSAACFGVVLGAIFMGAGWTRIGETASSPLLPSPEQASRAAVVSAVAGAFGLWISAASVLPTILLVGIAGLGVAWWSNRSPAAKNVQFDPRVWRLWGRVGCVGALIAYVIEYAPAHLHLRLEVNNPVYALAWLGGAELIATAFDREAQHRRIRLAASLLAVAAPVVTILIAGGGVFSLVDPALREMHATIGEFQSLPNAIRSLGPGSGWRFVPGFALLLGIGALPFAQGIDRRALAFASAIALPLVVLACWQVRWWLIASGAELGLLIAAVTAITWRRPNAQWIATFAISVLFISQLASRVSLTRRNIAARAVSPEDALQPMYRDAAVVLRQFGKDTSIVLLASPNASNAIGYYGSFRTIGSLYWENADGLRAAASIFSAATDDQARALIQSRRITHIAMISADNYLAEYARIARGTPGFEESSSTFGSRLLAGSDTASWLQPIPFQPRLPFAEQSASLFRVVPPQTPFELRWSYAVADAAAGKFADAERSFRRAIGLRSPESQGLLFVTAGSVAYQWNAYALAVRLFQSGADSKEAVVARTNIAWILATSADPAVRNGAAALELAKSLAAKNPTNPTILDVLAAALAESGMFEQAASIEAQLVAQALAAGDQDAAARGRTRQAAYSRGQPWRQ